MSSAMLNPSQLIAVSYDIMLHSALEHDLHFVVINKQLCLNVKFEINPLTPTVARWVQL